MSLLLDGGGDQIVFDDVRCVADVPWNMEHGRISIGLGCRAVTNTMLMLGERPGPVVLGSVSTGGRARTPGWIWPLGTQPVIRKLSLPPLGA